MNLTLRSQGKRKCEEISQDILKVLNEHLEDENNQVRTYVNGTLYSVLESKKLRQEAKDCELDKALEYLLKNSEQNFMRQIEYVLSRLNREDEEEETKSQSSNDEEEEEEFDFDDEESDGEELDQYDDLDMYTGADADGLPRGEDWLMQNFLASNELAEGQNDLINQKLDEFEEMRQIALSKQWQEDQAEESGGEPKIRPTTPMKRKPTTPGKQGPFEVTLTTGDIVS